MRDELKKLTIEQRNADPEFTIDPGFINYRYCFSVFGTGFLNAFNNIRHQNDDWLAKRANDHYITRMILATCRNQSFPTLSLALQNPLVGQIICGIEALEGTEEVYTSESSFYNRVVLPFEYDREVKLFINPNYFVADTGKSEQAHPGEVAIIARIEKVIPEVILKPLVMGGPMLDPNNEMSEQMGLSAGYMWYGPIFFETMMENIDEFSKVRGVADYPRDEWTSIMSALAEEKVKTAVAEILGDEVKKDWGGEQNDHFSARVHLSGKKHTAAFAFKGPGSGFSEMTLKHLGKNQDQIIRLANSETDLLVVQHCHDIGENVRTTLRHFAVTFTRQRRYCCMDGQETYKLLKTYGKLK